MDAPAGRCAVPRALPGAIALARAAALAALVASGSAARAAEFDCEAPGDRRHLRLELPGEEHLCEVSVSYRSTGERRVMWYADNDSAFCSDRLEELVGKYEDRWSFDCTRWPDLSGVDALDPARRAALDADIRRRRDALDEGERLVGVRVQRGEAADGTPLEATGFIVRNADGGVRTALVLRRGDTALARTEDLAGSLSTASATVRGAWVEAIGADGTLRVATDVVPLRRNRAGGDCRGRQSLRADADGALVPSTPHRFSCDAMVASGD